MGVPNSWFEEQPDRIICSVQDVKQDEREFGPQIVVEALPLGESVPRLLFFSAKSPNSPRSKWQKWLKAWKDVGVKPSSEDDLVGKIVMFEMVPQTYNIDGETRESIFWKPVKTYDSEADAMPDMDQIAQGATPTVEETMESSGTITGELVAQARGVYEALGSDDEQFLGVAESSYPGVDTTELLARVKEEEVE